MSTAPLELLWWSDELGDYILQYDSYYDMFEAKGVHHFVCDYLRAQLEDEVAKKAPANDKLLPLVLRLARMERLVCPQPGGDCSAVALEVDAGLS